MTEVTQKINAMAEMRSGRSQFINGNERKVGVTHTPSGLRISGLPKGCMYIEGQLLAFRKMVREELMERGTEASRLYLEATLQSALRHEARALLAGRWLRKEGESLTIEQRVLLLREISNATHRRDLCLRQMGLHKSATEKAVSILYEGIENEEDDDDDSE